MNYRALIKTAALASMILASWGCNANRTQQKAPETFRVRLNTTKGSFIVLTHREWSPLGADRFYQLTKARYYEGNYFFRVLPGFIAQWGINGDPSVAKKWENAAIKDDPPQESNKRGTVVFATGGPDTRTTQLFINLVDNGAKLDSRGFTPFGEVSEGMNVVESFYAGYGEGAPGGSGPDQNAITETGNRYLQERFPKLDRVIGVGLLD